MPAPDPIPTRFARIAAAFDKDGFDIQPTDSPDGSGKVPYQQKDGCIGVAAVSRTSTTHDDGRAKLVYYVEGDNYQMGYLIGLLAEPDVAQMTGPFAHNIVFDFVHAYALENATGELATALKNLIVDIVFRLSQEMKPDIPQEYVDELQGILDGCQAAKPATTVTWEDLWALNFGIDCLLAHVYHGGLFKKAHIPPFVLKVPYMCNAMFLGSALTDDGHHYFGRDFMFSTANVFQDTATLIIYRPDDRDGKARRPFVSQTAPGFVGSIIALNDQGVAMGVNMLPSHQCNPARPGLNSLTLVRDCMQYSSSADDAVDRIVAAPRGVTWLYPVGDKSGRSCVVEAGMYVDGEIPFFDGVPEHFIGSLPDQKYIDDERAKYGTPATRNGTMSRWSDYPYPQDYVGWNHGLWKAWNDYVVHRAEMLVKDAITDLELYLKGDFTQLRVEIAKQLLEWKKPVLYSPTWMGEHDFIDKLWTDRHCPATYYFAPQRELSTDILLASNMAITPEMRFGMMNEWVVTLSGTEYDDMQWRYDQLNWRLWKEQQGKAITWDVAWSLANFLRPGPDPYTPEGSYHCDPSEWVGCQITGSISLCDLDTSTIKSLYGYYGDEPLTLHLLAYL